MSKHGRGRHASPVSARERNVPSWADTSADELELQQLKRQVRRNNRRSLRRAALVGAVIGAASLLVPHSLPTESMPKTAAEAPASPEPSKKAPAPKPTPAPSETGTPIDVSRPKLPSKIGSIANATVEIVNPVHDINRTYFGSGTILQYGNKRVVMTAAHVTAKTNIACADDTVSYPSTSKVVAGSGSVTGTSPSTENGIRPDGTYVNMYKYNGGKDAALLIPEGQAALNGRPSLEVQDQVHVKPGDRVFSLGYGPRSEDYKLPFVYDPDPLAINSADREPQIIPGTVLGEQDNKIAFLTGITGYGMKPDHTVRAGDSGGTFIDANGNYLGDMIASAKESKGSEIEDTYGVDIPTANENDMYSVGFAQIIDRQTLGSLLDQTVPCTN
jgi:hypothetical protein